MAVAVVPVRMPGRGYEAIAAVAVTTGVRRGLEVEDPGLEHKGVEEGPHATLDAYRAITCA